MTRVILHSDLNSYYASVECIRHPELKGKPVAVCGEVEKRHGIVLAKTPEAKVYGVKTGEAIWQARQKCPGLVVLSPNYPLYLGYSRAVREIYGEYTDLQEPFGIDESWLDISGSVNLFGTGRTVAEDIRRRVKEELGLTVSIGVSWNKVFAKLGSDYKKPDAVTEITKENYKSLIWPLPVTELLYVGRATGRRLARYGITTIGQLAQAEPSFLCSVFGVLGHVLHRYANGEDLSRVARAGESAVIKSVGNSTTPCRDMTCEEDVKIVFYTLCESVASRLREQGFLCRGVQIHIRDNGLQSFERQCRLERPTDLTNELFEAAIALFRRNYDWTRPLRSIGVRAFDLCGDEENVQLSLFEDERRREKRAELERTVDMLKERFGQGCVRRAVTMINDLGEYGAKEEFNNGWELCDKLTKEA